MRISDWSSDVCSSDLLARCVEGGGGRAEHDHARVALGPEPQVAQEARRLAHAQQQHAGGVGVERAGVADLAGAAQPAGLEIGRASCRERVCQYVSISVGAGSLKKKNINITPIK